jgi:hypothetical protein
LQKNDTLFYFLTDWLQIMRFAFSRFSNNQEVTAPSIICVMNTLPGAGGEAPQAGDA